MEVEGRKDDEESGGVVRQPRKNVKGDVKQRWKIGFHNYDRSMFLTLVK